jgi:hypothetical protein
MSLTVAEIGLDEIEDRIRMAKVNLAFWEEMKAEKEAMG